MSFRAVGKGRVGDAEAESPDLSPMKSVWGPCVLMAIFMVISGEVRLELMSVELEA